MASFDVRDTPGVDNAGERDGRDDPGDGGAGNARGRAVTGWDPLDEVPIEHDRLSTTLIVLFVGVSITAVQQAIVWQLGTSASLVGAATCVVFAVLLLLVRQLAVRGRVEPALAGLASSVLIADMVLPLLTGDFLVFTGILPIVAVAILAPATTRTRLRVFAVVAWTVGMIATVVAVTQPSDRLAGIPSSETGWLLGVAVLEAAGLFTLISLDERRRVQVDWTRAANRTLRAANADLAFAEARYREMFDANPVPMSLYEVATLRFVAVNDAALALYGWSRAELLARTIEAVQPDDQADAFAEAIERARRGEPVRGRFRHRTSTGRIIDVEIQSAPVMFQGRPARLVAVTDVSERELLAAERDVLLELSADMVLVVDMNGTILRAGQATTDTLGYAPGALRDVRGLRLVHPADRGIMIAAIRRLRAGERVSDLEIRFRAATGEYRRLSWRATSDTKRGLIYAATRDVTDIRELEELHRHGERMRAVGRLAGGVAHDFNNLVTAIAGHAAFAAAGLPPDSPAREDIEAIRTSALRAQALTSQLLAFGRPGPGTPGRTSFRELTDRLEPMLRRLIHENITLDVRHLEPEVPIVVDGGQIERVIVNLVANARDAMPEGGCLEIVTSATHEGREERRMACLEVRDTGSGMSPEVRARVFEPFFTTKPIGKGTGLGLASAYGVVSVAGGRLDVDSTPGIGSTFRVLVPAADADSGEPAAHPGGDAAGPAPATTLPADETAPARRAGATILVVEDEPTIRRLAARVLERDGYRVLVAGHAAEALAIAAEQTAPIDMVFSDVVMPGRSGRELVRDLAARQPGIRVLLTSGYEEEPAAGDEGDAPPFLAKPYDPAVLVDRVREILGEPGAAT